MSAKRKCKLCGFKAARLSDLRIHWADSHGPEYAIVNKWLTEADEDILAAEALAAEGMHEH